jgi:cytidylate kinase
MSLKKIQIAVDGYSACGKSTLAKDLACKLGYIYIDSGAMYRAVTLYAINNNIIKNNIIDKNSLISNLPNISISFRLNKNNVPETYLNNINVENEIRQIEVSSCVSKISEIREVRAKMTSLQKQMGKDKGIIMDGRDIGTTVFPNAELKLFITADIDVRTQRRFDELKNSNPNIDFEAIKNNLIERDRIDTTRTESPLRKADDAIIIDNSNLSIPEQFEIAHNLYLEALNK